MYLNSSICLIYIDNERFRAYLLFCNHRKARTRRPIVGKHIHINVRNVFTDDNNNHIFFKSLVVVISLICISL